MPAQVGLIREQLRGLQDGYNAAMPAEQQLTGLNGTHTAHWGLSYSSIMVMTFDHPNNAWKWINYQCFLCEPFMQVLTLPL